MAVVWRLGLYATLLSVVASGVAMECPKGWHFYGERRLCFLVSTTPPLSWKQARHVCKGYGGDLTTILDSKTNEFVKDLTKSSNDDYWIGLHDMVTEDSFQWLEGDVEANFTYWAPNEPNNMGNEDCVFISARNESQWNDAKCSAHLAFLCQRAADTAIKPIDECPKGWHFYAETKQCFLLDSTPPLSWEQARAMCWFHGGDLTTIPDSRTNDFVTGLITSSCENYWIGLHDTVTENDFRWLDGDFEANFTNWAPNEPNNMSDEHCVFISAQNDSQWNDAKCTAEVGYSCQRPSRSNYELPPAGDEDQCPKGWHFYQDRKKCFLLDPKPPLSWKQARAMCRSYGGDMTTIPDSATNAFMKELMTSLNGKYWIGLHKTVTGTTNAFQWLGEDSEANFTDWALNGPSELDNEDCAFISAENKSQWKNLMCSAQIGFSCQRDANIIDTTTTTTTTQTPDTTATSSKHTQAPKVNEVWSTSTIATTKVVTSPTTEKTTKFVATQVVYRVVVKTGRRSKGGTDANVYIYLTGSRGSTRTMLLDTTANNFEQGDTDTFLLTARDVGPLNSIRISHDNSGDGPGWFLETVTVRRYIHQGMEIYDSRYTHSGVSYEVYVFAYNYWIARDEGDGRLYKYLRVTSKSLSFRN